MSLNVIQFPGRIPQWTFAERARKVRRDMHLTQAEMATQLDVGLKAYSAWESGKNSPEDLSDIAVKLERITGVPRVWFLGWADEDSSPTPPTDSQQNHQKITNRLRAMPSAGAGRERFVSALIDELAAEPLAA